MRILIVDDSRFTRGLIRRDLRGVHEVLEAANGLEGLKVVRLESPDLVLVDLLMPEMDGFDFLKGLQSMEYGGSVIVCSAQSQSSVEREIFGLGATAFIPKPDLLRAGRALEIVESALQRTSSASTRSGSVSRSPEVFDEVVDHVLESIADLFLASSGVAGASPAPPGGGATLRVTVRLGKLVCGSACLSLPNLLGSGFGADSEDADGGDLEADLARVILERLRERSDCRLSLTGFHVAPEVEDGSATTLRLGGRLLVPTLREEGEVSLSFEGWTRGTLATLLGRLECGRELVG